jgi:hypothetical protein
LLRNLNGLCTSFGPYAPRNRRLKCWCVSGVPTICQSSCCLAQGTTCRQVQTNSATTSTQFCMSAVRDWAVLQCQAFSKSHRH